MFLGIIFCIFYFVSIYDNIVLDCDSFFHSKHENRRT